MARHLALAALAAVALLAPRAAAAPKPAPVVCLDRPYKDYNCKKQVRG